MHDEEGPRRLKEGADTPETLLRALSALRKGVDDSARLQRVGQKMEGVLSSQPSAAPRLFGQKLSGLKLIVAGLGLLAPLFFFQLMDDRTVPSSDRAGSPQPSVAPQNAEKVETVPSAVIEPPVIAPPAAPPVGSTTPSVAAEEGQPLKRSTRSGTTRPRKQRERTEQPVAEEAARTNSELALKTDAIEAPDPERSARPGSEEAPAPAAAPAARPQPKAATAQEAPRVSEAELLLKARQALKRDPALALQLASEHQAQYANGRLVPEREVLAIEALRHLGRKQEADERLQKFEARYPASIHLKRLHESR